MNLPHKSFLPEMSIAIDAAVKAGEMVMNVYTSDFSHTTKEDNSPVTQADFKSNEIIQKILSQSGIEVLSEETKDTEARLAQNKVWIIDPMDGTKDFINKTGEFSIMVGLVHNGIPVIGVVLNPAHNVLYIAEIGKGAYQKKDNKWQKMHVSLVDDIHKAKAVVSRHHLSSEDELILKKLGVSSFIQKGSAGLKISEVAMGEADLYFARTDNMKQWDTAAAYSIITEAGGIITDMNGNELIYNTKDVYHKNGILVNNSLIHGEVLRRL